MPLMWAHAEYIRLLRSAVDGEVFDRIPAVAERYLGRHGCRALEVWKFNRQPTRVWAGVPLRIQAEAPFRLLWTLDDWATMESRDSQEVSGLGVHFLDLNVPQDGKPTLSFTFFWMEAGRWEGKNFDVTIENGTENPWKSG